MSERQSCSPLAASRSLALALLLLLPAHLASAGSVNTTTAIATDNAATCDIGEYTAATLLLPYFEVDYNASSTTAVDTVFSVMNTSRYPQIVRMTIWTDLGFPAAWCPIFLTGYGTMSVSMYNVVARGNLPVSSRFFYTGPMSADNKSNPNFAEDTFCDHAGGNLPANARERLQRMLSTGEREGSTCRVSSGHEHASGYITLDVVNSCSIDSPLDETYWRETILFDNVLSGEYERINPNVTTGNYAGGNPLVHIRAVPDGGLAGSTATQILPYTFYDRYTPANARRIDRRQPLPSVFAARWINGGPTGFMTNYVIWREGLTGPTSDVCAYAKNATVPLKSAMIVRFDEHENAVVMGCGAACSAAMPLAATVSSDSGMFPPAGTTGDVGGWMWISLDNGSASGTASGTASAGSSPYSSARASQNWMVIQMYAEGRYAVDYDATTVVNGCTTAPPARP
jgi:hypothetical protein